MNQPRISRTPRRIMSVKSVAGAVLLLALAAVTSCRKKDMAVIAVVPKSRAHVFWQAVHAGAAAAGDELDAKILWSGPASEMDSQRQVNIVDEFINQRVNGIVLAPCNGESLVPVVERAAQEHIPVVILDSGIRTEKYLSYVSSNNYRGGVLAAERLGAVLSWGEVAIIGTVPGSVSTSERENGFRETIASKFPGLQIVDFQYGMADPGQSLAVAEDMLAAHPDLAGFFCSSESGTAAAVRAAKSRGVARKLEIVGFDASPALIQDLQAGDVDCLVVQDPFRMGYLGVKAILDRLQGRTPDKRIDTVATVVTAANLQEPGVQKLIRPPIRSK